MLEAMYNKFIPKDVIKNRCDTDFEFISELAKSKLVVVLISIFTCSIIPIFVYRTFILQQWSINLAIMLITPAIFFSALLYFKKTGNYKPTIWVIYMAFLTILPVRAFYTGGLESPTISWFMTGAVIIAFLHEKKYTYLFYILTLTELVLLHFLETPPAKTTELLKFFTHFSAYIMIVTCIGNLIAINKTVIKENKKVEKANTIKLMVASLSHEINNPLSIGIGYLDQMEMKEKSKPITKIKDALLRIKETLKCIAEIDDVDNIKTSEYTDDVDIINLRSESDYPRSDQ